MEFLTQRMDVEKKLDAMLVSMGYPNSDKIIKGILDIINMISDYHEEGVPLFPDVIIVNTVSYFETLNSNRIRIAQKKLEQGDFSQSIKMCAPLAVDGWGIYIIISEKDDSIEYGILSTELQTLSLGLYEQAMEAGIPEINSLFIRNVGNKVVEVRDVQNQLMIFFSLSEVYAPMGDTVKKLVNCILADNDDDLRELRNYLSKTILQALNEGHGNLIAVVKEDDAIIKATLENLHGGINLEEPIDLRKLALEYQKFKTEDTSVKLRSYAGLMQSMLNFDGITLFSDNGKVLGCHFIVNNNTVTDEHVQGGSRTRAFHALCDMESIRACFMKSQDGKIKFFKR